MCHWTSFKIDEAQICEWIRIKSTDKHMALFLKNLNWVYSLCLFPEDVYNAAKLWRQAWCRGYEEKYKTLKCFSTVPQQFPLLSLIWVRLERYYIWDGRKINILFLLFHCFNHLKCEPQGHWHSSKVWHKILSDIHIKPIEIVPITLKTRVPFLGVQQERKIPPLVNIYRTIFWHLKKRIRIILSLLILWSNESQTSLNEAQHQCRRTSRWCNFGAYNWIFSGPSDAKAKTPIPWPPDVKSWLIAKDPDAGKDWREVEKGMTEDEMVGWHHWINGLEFGQTLGDGEG